MKVERLADGLWRWTCAHPAWTPAAGSPTGWPREVGCTYYEPRNAPGVVLVDPLVPREPDQSERFWRALDGDVARRGGGVDVFLTNAWHGRSADAIRKRYGAPVRVHAHADAVDEVQAEITHPWRGAEARLPGGIRGCRIRPCDGGESLYQLPFGEGLCFGDALSGIGDGRVRTLPTSWGPPRGASTFQSRVRRSLEPMLRRRFRRLLVTHGEPVLTDARAALREALSSPPKGG